MINCNIHIWSMTDNDINHCTISPLIIRHFHTVVASRIASLTRDHWEVWQVSYGNCLPFVGCNQFLAVCSTHCEPCSTLAIWISQLTSILKSRWTNGSSRYIWLAIGICGVIWRAAPLLLQILIIAIEGSRWSSKTCCAVCGLLRSEKALKLALRVQTLITLNRFLIISGVS